MPKLPQINEAVAAIDHIHSVGPFAVGDDVQRGKDIAAVKRGLQFSERTIERLAERLRSVGIDASKYID